MPDNFADYKSGLNSPAEDAFAVTPNDSVDLAISTRYIYVGGAGSLVVTTVKGTTVTFSGVPVGSVLGIRAKRIHATGTTATNIVGLV